MEHIFKKGKNLDGNTLLMLHGTGGSEFDLLDIADFIDSDANVLSLRGEVLENGMSRFFKRLAEGVFDIEDLISRTHQIKKEILEFSQIYGFNKDKIIPIGYSNGANIAGSLIFHYPSLFKAAILFHPMVPLRNMKIDSLKNLPIFIGAGIKDPICSVAETNELTEILLKNKAEVSVNWYQFGHALSQDEINDARVWFQKNIK